MHLFYLQKSNIFWNGTAPSQNPLWWGGYKPHHQNPVYPVSICGRSTSPSTSQNVVSVSIGSALPEIWLPQCPMQCWLAMCLQLFPIVSV